MKKPVTHKCAICNHIAGNSTMCKRGGRWECFSRRACNARVKKLANTLAGGVMSAALAPVSADALTRALSLLRSKGEDSSDVTRAAATRMNEWLGYNGDGPIDPDETPAKLFAKNITNTRDICHLCKCDSCGSESYSGNKFHHMTVKMFADPEFCKCGGRFFVTCPPGCVGVSGVLGALAGGLMRESLAKGLQEIINLSKVYKTKSDSEISQMPFPIKRDMGKIHDLAKELFGIRGT